MQVLMTIPNFKERYFNNSNEILNSSSYSDCSKNFNVQMAKLAVGLHSGR